MELAIIAASGFVGGTLIGAVSVGGVIVLPALVGLAGLPLRDAIQLTFIGFAAAGLSALLTSLPADLRHGTPLLAATIPGAVAGTMLVHAIPAPFVILFVAATALGSLGLGLLPRRFETKDSLQPVTSIGLGALTGFGSALSGSGGPLILTPLLIMVRIDVRRSIRLAQIAQLPIAIAASVTHFKYSPIDHVGSLVIGTSMFAGTILGTRLQGRVSTNWLKRATVIAVLLTTAAMLAALLTGEA